MSKSRTNRKYESPRGINLNEFSGTASGQDHALGVCKSGQNPFYNCVAGPDFLGQCETGATPDTSACSGGGYHLSPACDTGSSAATICISGNGQQ